MTYGNANQREQQYWTSHTASSLCIFCSFALQSLFCFRHRTQRCEDWSRLSTAGTFPGVWKPLKELSTIPLQGPGSKWSSWDMILPPKCPCSVGSFFKKIGVALAVWTFLTGRVLEWWHIWHHCCIVPCVKTALFHASGLICLIIMSL